MKYFNCHTHTFNMQYLPEDFLRLQTSPRLANALHWVLSKSWIANPLLWLSKFFFKGKNAKMIAFLKIGLMKTQDMVFADLCSKYPKDDEVKYIILPIDFTYMGAGAVKIPYKQQLDDLFSLKLKYPNKCYPFVAIDPRNGNAQENKKFVEYYINKGFSGIKLYPALGFFGFDEGLKEVFQYAESEKIPIMTHCSTGGINYGESKAPGSFENPKPFYRIDGKNYFFPQGNKSMKDYCDQFNDCANFEEALMKFRNLKICFAHFGLNSTDQYEPNGLEWFNKIISLMRKYPNVYTDISFSVSYKGFCKWFADQYQTWSTTADRPLQDRVLFGTDYFMTVQQPYGDDDEILKVAKEEFGEELFLKLANDNVLKYLER